MADQLTYDTLYAQVLDLFAADSRTPTAIRLGTAQRQALEQHVREISGQKDVGPVISFAGLDVVSSDAADQMALVWSKGTSVPKPTPEAPPAPAETAPSAD